VLPQFHSAPWIGSCRWTATHNQAGPGRGDGLDGRLASFRYLHAAQPP
jgi:hypothetical protein